MRSLEKFKNQKAVENRINEIEEEIRVIKLSSKLDITNDFSTLTNANERLGKCISSISESLNSIIEAKPQSSMDLDETSNREKRVNNLVIFGIEEMNNQSQLMETIKNIFNEISPDIEDDEISTIERIGRSEIYQKLHKPRPVIVKFHSTSTKFQILRHAKTLKDSPKYCNIFVAPDLTPLQRLRNKHLREELRKRRESGETNLKIKKGEIIKEYVKTVERQSIFSNRQFTTLSL